MTNSEYLREAAAVLRKDGWVRGERTDIKGRHCILGAFDKASGGWKTTDLAAIIAPYLPVPPKDSCDTYNGGNIITAQSTPDSKVACWNNMIATDIDDVVAKLKFVADALDAKEKESCLEPPAAL